MAKALNDNTDTWTHISVAAERVLAKVKQIENVDARETSEEAEQRDNTENNSNRADRACVAIENKRARLGARQVGRRGARI